jgi:hypothetical protein
MFKAFIVKSWEVYYYIEALKGQYTKLRKYTVMWFDGVKNKLFGGQVYAISPVMWYTSIILATQEVEIRGITVQGHLGPKVRKTHLTQQARYGNVHLWSWLHGKQREEDRGPGQHWAKTRDPIQKITKAKRGLRIWLKWQSTCLASVRTWVQNPSTSNNK